MDITCKKWKGKRSFICYQSTTGTWQYYGTRGTTTITSYYQQTLIRITWYQVIVRQPLLLVVEVLLLPPLYLVLLGTRVPGNSTVVQYSQLATSSTIWQYYQQLLVVGRSSYYGSSTLVPGGTTSEYNIAVSNGIYCHMVDPMQIQY